MGKERAAIYAALLKGMEEAKRKAGAEGDEDGMFVLTPVFLKPRLWIWFWYLVNFQIKNYPNAEKADDGWFPCTIEDLQNLLGAHAGPSSQTRNLKELSRLGYLQRRLTSECPPSRLIRIDYEKFNRDLIAAKANMSPLEV